MSLKTNGLGQGAGTFAGRAPSVQGQASTESSPPSLLLTCKVLDVPEMREITRFIACEGCNDMT